jgi:phage major head subunit gpT-like protein
MTFEQWLKAKGFDKATLTAAQLTLLEAEFKANASDERVAQLKAAFAPVEAKKPEEKKPEEKAPADNGLATIRAEHIRIADIERVAAGNPDIKAKAIKEGWTVDATELAVLRASRPTAPGGIVHGAPQANTQVLEAAMAQSLGLPNIEKAYKPETLEAAHTQFRGRLGINQLLMIAAVQAGFSAGPGVCVEAGNLREVLGHAMPPRHIRAAASTIDVSGILSNVTNKEIIAGYMEEDQSWREIAAVRPVGDFKAVTSYRMLDNMEYEEVGGDGKIKHGTASEESYTRQAKTYAKMFALTRTDIINDDGGAFDDIKARLGRGSALKFNRVFWAKFLANTGLFTAGRGNYITGATTTLLTDGVGLGLAVKAFRNLKTSTDDGQKKVGVTIGGQPTILLVPSSLEAAAEGLYKNQNLSAVATSSANIYANKYKPVVSPWLEDSALSGYSATAWYLLRNPQILASIVVSFLNGMQTPTVESADADFDTLGIQFRGYHDFGVDLAEYLAGIKSKGAA